MNAVSYMGEVLPTPSGLKAAIGAIGVEFCLSAGSSDIKKIQDN